MRRGREHPKLRVNPLCRGDCWRVSSGNRRSIVAVPVGGDDGELPITGAGLPYGHQALFMKRQAFMDMGGFKEMPVMEHYHWIRQARRHGPIIIVAPRVTTSARRWEQKGVMRLTLAYQMMVAGYHLGVSPQKLARWR